MRFYMLNGFGWVIVASLVDQLSDQAGLFSRSG